MILELSPAGRRYGYIPNPPDHRDFGLLHPALPFDFFAANAAITLPRSSNRKYLGPFRDQADEGSCTGHADSADRNFLYNKLVAYEKVKLPASPNFSPAFAYYMGRKIDGSLGQGDCGSTGRSVALGCIKYGNCQESDWPYVAGQFDVAPSDAQLAAAAVFAGGAFHSVASPLDIRSCLASEYGVLLGFSVWESFETKIGSSGLMPTPDYKNERMLGGHEVFIFDYDDEKTMGDGVQGGVCIQNSWGTGFGDGGTFWMSYKQLADPNIFLDATLQHTGKPWLAKAA